MKPLCCTLILLCLVACSRPPTNVETGLRDQVLHLGNGAEPQSLDPHLATSVGAHHILAALVEGLVGEHPRDLRPISTGAAESWSVKTNKIEQVFYDLTDVEGNKTLKNLEVITKPHNQVAFTFNLREKARWSNGDPVTAGDFAYSYRRMLNPGLAAQYAYMLHVFNNAKLFHEGRKCEGLWLLPKKGEPTRREHVAHYAEWEKLDAVERHRALQSLRPEKEDQDAVCPFCEKKLEPLDWEDWGRANVGVEALDESTLRLTLENPTPYFLELLNHYSFWPVHKKTVENAGARDRRDRPWARPGTFVGNGPFTLDEWGINARIVVRRNPDYWGWSEVNGTLQAIHFYPIDIVDTEERAFRAGFLHNTQTVPPHRLDSLRSTHPNELHIDTYLGVYFYRLNTKPPKSHPKDKPWPLANRDVRRALALAINREELIKYVMKAGQQPAYYFTPRGTGNFFARDQFKYDFKEAIREAKRLIAGYLEREGLKEMPKIELKFNTSESHKKVAVAIQQMWKSELGIKNVVLDNQEWKVFLKTTELMNYEIARAGWIGDYNDPNTFLDMWVTDGGHNNTGWSSERYDELIKLAAAESDPKKRFEYFHECEKILGEEMPMIPIYIYVSSSLRHPSVRGWHPTVLDHHPYKYVRLQE